MIDRSGLQPSRTIEPMGTLRGSRDLVAISMIVVILSRVIEGPAAWLVGACLLAAVVLGALQVLGDGIPATAGPGVPIEALVTPGVTVVAIFGTLRLVPIGPLLIPAAVIGGWLLLRVLGTEARLLATATGPSGADRTAVRAETLIVGFLAFLGMAALVPGGLPEPGVVTGGPTGPQLALLATVDAVTAFLLGYRVGALRTSNLRDVSWFALTSASVIAIAAAALRTMEIPRLLGPALLVLVFFLWDAIHADSASRRQSSRRLRETILLMVLGLVVVVWSVRLRS